ncbi:MAG: FAD-dependent monooxygenase [Acidobacteriota bacterium]|nr:FAD-dependent monooxygenase [Acidobacteriota bacterium]
MKNKRVIIIGAGLSGSLLAIYLAKRGIETDVYEARADMRKVRMSAGRSINLALSDRGIAALREIGMDEYMLAEAVPMLGRMVHAIDGQTKLLRYSGRAGEYINSVSRAGLNVALINEAEKYRGVRFHFNEKCVDFDCRTGEALIENAETGDKKSIKADTLIATDGAGSAVRRAMLDGGVPRFNFSQRFLEHGYKELHIPSASEPSAVAGGLTRSALDSNETEAGSNTESRALNANDASSANLQPPATAGGSDNFLMEKNALHIWARRAFMMIALPNFDGSFTCTLFLAHEGENSFAQLRDEKSLLDFFRTNFADAIPLMPTLTEDFFANPIGNLGTVKCFPWNVGGKSLLLGDSAHAVVPFYGQGMNCAFEDCRVLDSLIEKHGTDCWETIFEEYGKLRKENTDAIADMAEENFYEMRDAVADPVFVRKRELETRLEQTFPDYFSKYSMVTFREDLPYAVAKRKGNAQDKLLMEICAANEDLKGIGLDEVMKKIKSLEPS